MRIFLLFGAAMVVGCAATPNRAESMSIVTMQQYVAALTLHVSKNWVQPESHNESLNCVVNISQDSDGKVKSVNLAKCNGSDDDVMSIKRAVEAASPLPLPDNPALFDPDIRLIFCPNC